MEQLLELWHSMRQSWNDPPRLHAFAVHAPIAVAMVGMLLALLLLGTAGRSGPVRWICVLFYILGAAGAWLASEAGERALEMAPIMEMTAEAQAEAERHEQMGGWVAPQLAICAVLVALTAIKPRALRVFSLVLATLATLFAAGWVAATAHHGGSLVYVHGLNVPGSVNNRVPAPPDEIPATQQAPTTQGSTTFFGIPTR